MAEDKRMTNAQYLGAVILIFCMAFGMYASGYKHGEEKLWGDVWAKPNVKIIKEYIGWRHCDTPPWKNQEKK